MGRLILPPPHALYIATDRAGWAADAAEAIAEALLLNRRDDTDGVPHPWLAIAGGSTPKPVLEQLALCPEDLVDVIITPTDDRQVPEDHPARNRAMVATCLASAEADVRPLEAMRLDDSPTVVVLGYGNDRHIASLFPAGDGMAAALDPDHPDAWALATPDPLPPEAPFPRASLTLGAILRAGAVIVLATGEAKRATLEAALAEGGASGDEQALSPLARLLSQSRVPVHIYLGP